jgi:hypothetical protein
LLKGEGVGRKLIFVLLGIAVLVLLLSIALNNAAEPSGQPQNHYPNPRPTDQNRGS